MSRLSTKALKVTYLGAFFSFLRCSAFLALILAGSAFSHAGSNRWQKGDLGCRLTDKQADLDRVEVSNITDGDTVVLSGGERLRLLGLNAPELARDDRPAQPLANVAKGYLTEIIRKQTHWYLLKSLRNKDRHGRLLGDLIDEQGYSVSSRLVASGNAFAVVKWPDIDHATCFMQKERAAKVDGKGVWGEAYWMPLRAEKVSDNTLGFRLINGTVTKVDFAKKVFIELDDNIVLRLPKAALNGLQAEQMLGKTLHTRGWIKRRDASRYSYAAHKHQFKVYIVDLSNSYELSWQD